VNAAGVDAIRDIAEAVLYEGYILWPYRRSAMKNQQRWTFGGIYPEAYSKGTDGSDPCLMQTQCLLRTSEKTRVDVGVRFLQVVERAVLRNLGDSLERVDELRVGEERYLSWDEAAEREVSVAGLDPSRLQEPVRVGIDISPSAERELLRDADGVTVGALDRSWCGIRGEVEVGAEPLDDDVYRVTVRINNGTPWRSGTRSDALRQTLVSTHTILRTAGGSWASLMDPPPELQGFAEECHNVGTWPVLVGEEGEAHTMLSSPIILYDYPKVAPESPGDLFDGSEIDQLLILSILSMTDQERQDMRDSDPRARQILERSESLSQEDLMRLHGTWRDLGQVRER
jgi:hypothetical protein